MFVLQWSSVTSQWSQCAPIKCRGWKGVILNTDKVKKCASFAIAHETVDIKAKHPLSGNLRSQPDIFICLSTLGDNIIQITRLRLFCFNTLHVNIYFECEKYGIFHISSRKAKQIIQSKGSMQEGHNFIS